jgi:hypothetical protein
MSFIVLANSTRVILPMRTRFERPDRMPTLAGVLVAQAKASGHCMHSFIELDAPGLPRPFRGERWCYEWRADGDNLLACWLGFPNVFFSAHIDPNLRVSVEALGRFGTDKGPLSSLARIHVTVKPGGETGPRPDDAAWVPDDETRVVF